MKTRFSPYKTLAPVNLPVAIQTNPSQGGSTRCCITLDKREGLLICEDRRWWKGLEIAIESMMGGVESEASIRPDIKG